MPEALEPDLARIERYLKDILLACIKFRSFVEFQMLSSNELVNIYRILKFEIISIFIQPFNFDDCKAVFPFVS